MTLGNDNGTDGQTDRQTDRQSATQYAAPSRDEGRIIKTSLNQRNVRREQTLSGRFSPLSALLPLCGLPLHAPLPLKRAMECPLTAPAYPIFCPLRSHAQMSNHLRRRGYVFRKKPRLFTENSSFFKVWFLSF